MLNSVKHNNLRPLCAQGLKKCAVALVFLVFFKNKEVVGGEEFVFWMVFLCYFTLRG